jgi:hypothetical protein
MRGLAKDRRASTLTVDTAKRGQSLRLIAVAILLSLGANVQAIAQGANYISERYGSREAQTCENTKAPATGAITAALAQKYFVCGAEGISGSQLFLIENVKLEVGAAVPYHPTLGAFEAINVRAPLYPIRGSYLRYQCKDLVTEHVGPPDTNCNTYNNPKATGYCYKTTFGDWRCSMADRAMSSNENWRTRVAPPKAPRPR